MTTEIKMVVTDLDGTLLKNDKSISEQTKAVITKLRRNNILFVIATARPIRAVKKTLPFIQYDAAVFHNGAVVLVGDTPIEGFGILNPLTIIQAVLKETPRIRIAMEAEDVLYSNFNAEEFWPGVEYRKTMDFRETEGLTADKIIVEAHSMEEMKLLEKYVPDDLYLQLSENLVAMILNRKATKMNGVRRLAEFYGILPEQIIAFGDDYNDIDMLEACGIGVAVGNALPEVKLVADYICDSNEQDGVAGWLPPVLKWR